MRIGRLAERTGVAIDTLRFYEKKGLLDETHFQRSENGYRDYTDKAVQQLEMIKHAQAAGFSLTEIGELLGLWEQNQLTNDQIVAHLQEKQRVIAGKIAELEQVQHYITGKLQQLAYAIHGTDRETPAR